MEKVKLSDICNPKQWRTIPTSDLLNEGYPVYGANGIIGYYSEYNHENPVVTVTCRGATCGSINITVPNAYITGNAMCLDDVRSDIEMDYLYYCLKHYNFNNVISGSAQPQITRQGMDKIYISIYGHDEQKKIIEKLKKVENIINLRKQEIQLLDDFIKARFVELFGDVVHNDKCWEFHRFSDITSSRLGKMLDKKQQTGKYQFPYLANINVQWFRFETDSLSQMDFDESDQKEFALEDGDLLVCEGGEIGRCAVWHNNVQPCYFQKALHRVRCNQELILPDYLAWWFKFNCDNKGFAEIEGAKATIAHLPGVKLKALSVVVPPITLQNQFVDFVHQVNKLKVEVQKALNETQLLFDSLMQEYFG